MKRYILKKNPHYDEDPSKALEGSLIGHVDGSAAAPSETTLLKFLSAENNKQRPKSYNPQGYVSEIGFYPLDGRRPFTATSEREPDGELPYTNNEGFAYAVATRLLMEYKMAKTTNHTDEELKEKLFIRPRRYKLPDKFLAMDVLLCNKYCLEVFEGYLSKNKKVATSFIRMSKIKHYKVCNGTTRDLERRKEEIMF